MELWALQTIVEGTNSLAELERQYPILGRKLNDFVSTVNVCCRAAYGRFSACLDDVLVLPSQPSDKEKAATLQKLRDTSDSSWFREIAQICDNLAGLANTYDADIRKHAKRRAAAKGGKRSSLGTLLALLHRYEGDLTVDIRNSVDHLKTYIADNNVAEARQRALAIKDEIARNLTRINGVALAISGSTTDGANQILTREQIAEAALRKPERVLIFNMTMVVILLIIGGTVLQYVSLLAFPLLTGFVVTAIVVVNAFYLRSIDKLREDSFMALLKLALLKFFAPLARPPRQSRSSGTE